MSIEPRAEARRDGLSPLAELKVGQRCVVRRLSGAASDRAAAALRRRLLDMGLTPGTEAALVKTAPLGDPMELRLRGYNLSLRRGDADGIWVEILDGGVRV
jgi:Fe2+ transport system protein FeoA